VLADGAYLEDAGERSPALRACIVAASCVDRLVRALRAAEGGLIFDGLAADEAGCVGTQDRLAILTHTVAIMVSCPGCTLSKFHNHSIVF